MKFTKTLKNINRVVPEMECGIAVTGIVLWIIVLLLGGEHRWWYSASLWLGVITAMCGVFHMYRVLDRALDYDEKNASKLIFAGYTARYTFIVVMTVITGISGVLNPLLYILGVFTLKAGAYLQPTCHRIFLKILHETEPEPEPLVEETEQPDLQEAQESSLPQENLETRVNDSPESADNET